MDRSNATLCSEDLELQKNQAENLEETNTLRKRRNSASSLPEDEPDITKIKTDCDGPENEKKNDDGNIPQLVKKREEAEKFPKLYRLLRDYEFITKGLSAKQPDAKEDVATHVATGNKRGYSSQYISTCAKLYNAESFRSLKLNSAYKWDMKHIAKIDVESLKGDVKIIDLTTNKLRIKYEINEKEVNEKFHKFADSHQEVLLVGIVPPSCLKLIECTGVVPDLDNSCSDSDDSIDFELLFVRDSHNSNSDSD
ncbi:uncharacterized protein [Mytilus edulis]